MIALFFIDVLVAVGIAIIGLLPTATPPDTSQAKLTIQQMVQYADQLGNWVPLGTCAIAFGVIFLGWSVGLAIKVMRMSASMLTGGGGSAG